MLSGSTSPGSISSACNRRKEACHSIFWYKRHIPNWTVDELLMMGVISSWVRSLIFCLPCISRDIDARSKLKMITTRKSSSLVILIQCLYIVHSIPALHVTNCWCVSVVQSSLTVQKETTGFSVSFCWSHMWFHVHLYFPSILSICICFPCPYRMTCSTVHIWNV